MQVVHQSRSIVPRDRLVRLPEVESLTGCKKSTLYTMIGQGKFPRPVRLSTRHVAWAETAVLLWVQERIAQAQGGQ